LNRQAAINDLVSKGIDRLTAEYLISEAEKQADLIIKNRGLKMVETMQGISADQVYQSIDDVLFRNIGKRYSGAGAATMKAACVKAVAQKPSGTLPELVALAKTIQQTEAGAVDYFTKFQQDLRAGRFSIVIAGAAILGGLWFLTRKKR